VRRLIVISAVAAVTLGTAAAAADNYSRKLAPWGQLTQATEKPPGETAGWAPADVATAVLKQQDVKSVLGRQVRSITGEDMGRVVNVVVDRSGQVRAAIIDFGGFLGIGNRKIAIDWNALHHFATPEDDRITLDLHARPGEGGPRIQRWGPLVVITTSD
jgi:sporulation protein YlmC with PRC-barrel domain